MKVLFTSAESLAEGYAPAAFIEGLGGALSALGHEVHICAVDSGSYHRSSVIGRIWRYIAVNAMVVSSMWRSDVIISRAHFAHLPWALVAALSRKRVVHMMNGFVEDASTTHRMGRLTRALALASYRIQFRLANQVVAATREIANSMAEQFRIQNLAVIRNGVNAEQFKPVTRLPGAERFIVFPSSLALWHDAETIFAATELPSWPADVHVAIVGEGKMSEHVRLKAMVNGKIRYLGLLPRDELRDILPRAVLGLCLILRLDARKVNEVYPLKLFEMMACGLPVVVSDLPGQRDIVLNSGAGRVIPERNPQALVDTVNELLQNPDLENIGKAGAAYVAEHYKWSISARKLLDLIENKGPAASREA